MYSQIFVLILSFIETTDQTYQMSKNPKDNKQQPQTKQQLKDQKPTKQPEGHQNNENHQKESHIQQQKQLRRVAQRSQIPADKTQLIQYLSSRIKQAQDALMDTEQLLEEQIKEREKIAKALDERNDQLSKLYQVDQRALPQKIKQKLSQILTTTVTQKMESEQKLQEEKLKNYQYKARYDQLRWEDKNNKSKLQEQQKKQGQLNNDLQNLQEINRAHQEQLQSLQTQYNRLRQNKQALQDKYLQMKVALDRMGDVKGVLNRFFTNQDLWNQKMDLKQQKIQRLPQPAKQTTNLPPPSRESRVKPGNNSTKLKPITKQKNDDDDFWKADFKGKN